MADHALCKYTVSTHFRGHEVSLLQVPRDKTPDGQDNTGWCVWEASNIIARYLADDNNVAHVLGVFGSSATAVGVPFEELCIVDLSAGAGLLAIAFAKAGARVAATDVPAQLQQLRDNIDRAGLRVADELDHTAGSVAVLPLFWGASLAALRLRAAPGAAPAAPPYDLVVASDILFIAVRDGRTRELRRTLVELLLGSSAGAPPVCRAVVFGYEERLFREERAFMEALGIVPGAAETGPRDRDAATSRAGGDRDAGWDTLDAATLAVEELTGEAVAVTYEQSLKGAGGHADTDLWSPALFWEPPPVRVFVLRAPPPAPPAADARE